MQAVNVDGGASTVQAASPVLRETGYGRIVVTERSRRNVWLFATEAPTLIGARPAPAPHVVATFTIVEGGMSDDHKTGSVEDATRCIRETCARGPGLGPHPGDRRRELGSGRKITRLADAQAILGATTP